MEPQLLTVIEKEVLKKWPAREWANWQIEPKRDGFRLLIVGGKAQSRTGKPLHNIDHIIESFQDFPDAVFDGELHGSTWEETSHVARASKSERDIKLTYTIFDALTLKEWQQQFAVATLEQRQHALWAAGNLLQKNKYIKIVQPWDINNFHEFEAVHKLNLSEGCDGTVLKRKDSLYEFKRVKTWLKVKPAMDFDATVVGVAEGKGKYQGTLGKLLCSHNGVEFGLSGMTDAQRDEWWEYPPTGAKVEVTCRGFHPSGAPIEPRFNRMRTDL